jgi:lysophospholipase L1-like esterase
LTINGAGNQQFDSPKDAAQLSALGTNTKYVTLTVGGNDVRFANLIDGCLVAALATKHKNKPPTATVFNAKSFIAATGGDGTGALHQSPSECRQVIGVYEKHFVHGLRTKLVSLYREILKRAPIARLVVATYPRILRPSFQGVTVANVRLCAAVGQSISHARIGIYDENVSDLTSFQAALNDEISAAVKTVKANNPRRIALVDIYAKTTNNGITCGDKGITNYMSALRLAFSGKVVSTASFHPNKAGQKFMAQELRKALTK